MKRILIFVIAVVALVFVITYGLNRHNHVQPNDKNENKISGRIAKEDVDYETIVNKKEPVYKNIDKYLKKEKFNGTIVIYHQGKIMLNKGYGFQDFDIAQKASPNTMYLIGSAQKFTTGLMLKKLETEGKVNINDPITKYLPWFKTSKPLYLKDFMLHRTGLKKYKATSQIHDIDGASKWMQNEGIQPGMYHKHMYNDGNYIVLARVIEVVTKESYAKYFNDNFAKPYDLERTAFYNDTTFQPYMAQGYNNMKIFQKPEFLDQYYGAGNLYMAPKDVAKLVIDLQNYKIFSKQVTDPLLYSVKTKEYPGSYRYGFYSNGQEHRLNGVFFGQQLTSYFNKDYVVVLGNNYQNKTGKNEKMLYHIYVNMLHQRSPNVKKPIKKINRQNVG
ncbi:serine hydrolase domain-containing protein [Staphylococcus carnosus]|uniref:serine hydrolase domain-containing protein n=1 Tax=Staphylococcus carnosus TaxID=1281 RepID=UPI000CD2BC73|nr:serine hydrolase domain-containing protein [Staphylococcus carnosus]POA00440.1 methicillin resistance protein FmtA [Staphylococcus carnosus]QRQ05604.1 beta-lactamase family protein [Staphylococcus carnosus]SUM07290.1 autolysis and methicillin resistant-like protein [Staphylococcus carnosus]